MLSLREKNELLNKFNKLYSIELSYEKIIHNKVYDKIDYYILIPHGNKCYLWFTHYKNNFLSLTIEINKYNNLLNLKTIKSCFNEELAFNNSLFLGYEFRLSNVSNSFFAITDIFYYQKINYRYLPYSQKFLKLINLFTNDTKQLNFTKDSTIIGLPKITYNLKNIDHDKENILYDLASILYIKDSLYHPFGISFYNINKKIYAIFKIKATIQNDIYNILIKDFNNKIIIYDSLLIDSYKTSIFMNKLFRNIKENYNLDLLEESDSESDFENTDISKHVNLNKELNIKCTYNLKFKKWIPIELSKENLTLYKDLLQILKK